MSGKVALQKAAPIKAGNSKPDPGEEPFLRLLGEHVREARARRGMTRRILARDSGVSERYLAQLEAGQGNVSVLRLRQVASALNLPLTELLREHTEHPELALTTEFLKRLRPQQLAMVRSQLVRDYNPGGAERMNRIALVGLRGAGKSTLGARLAGELKVPFIELDREIEREAGTSLKEIFLLHGQAGYRRCERRSLEKIIENHDRAVIATGGSIVSEPATYDLLLSTCFTVWLRATPQEHMARVVAQGDTRPIEGNSEAMDDLKRILQGREALYGQADAMVDTAGKPVEHSLASLKKVIGA
jgi:XRE family aerobic/anaerobic benzoate catabolism transcriptional regulator